MSEQQSQTATAVQAPTTSACPHPEAVCTRWGDQISEERQAELQGYLDRWAAETDHGEREGPFDEVPREAGVRLTGADVFWLAKRSGRDEYGWVPNLHLEGSNLGSAHLERADLRSTQLEQADLSGAYLKRADLRDAHLEGINLSGTHWRRPTSTTLG
jgi:hypothetical protein